MTSDASHRWVPGQPATSAQVEIDDTVAMASADLIRGDIERSARIVRDTSSMAHELLTVPAIDVDPERTSQLHAYHGGLDAIAERMRDDVPEVTTLMHHRGPFTSDMLEIVPHLTLHQRWPRLHIFGATNYRWGWTAESSTPGAPTPDRNQTVLLQNASFSLSQGTVHVDHRVSNGHANTRSYVGFPFTPGVTVGKISVRPYFQYVDSGFVSVDWSTAWTDGYDKARTYQYGEIFVTSVNAAGGDSRYEGPARARASYHHATPGAFGNFHDADGLDVRDGLALEAWVVNSRTYIVWVGCHAWSWSRIIPAQASSQAFVTLDCAIPFVVVEEWPVP